MLKTYLNTVLEKEAKILNLPRTVWPLLRRFLPLPSLSVFWKKGDDAQNLPEHLGWKGSWRFSTELIAKHCSQRKKGEDVQNLPEHLGWKGSWRFSTYLKTSQWKKERWRCLENVPEHPRLKGKWRFSTYLNLCLELNDLSSSSPLSSSSFSIRLLN